MKPCKILMLLALPLVLQACGGYRVFVRDLPADSVLTQLCKRPVTLPDGGMLQSDVESYWVRDRVNLIDCGEKHRLLVNYTNGR
jgi:hypothetical protein